MIVDTATDKAIVFSKDKTKSFSIKQNRKTFRSFSDGLYTDKISSIIRELSCNAVDIQNRIKNFTPFEIFIPSPSNPYFCIRDYGTGLTPDEIDNIYTVLGESTKDESNEDIGGFGLGSKTPFAYTDQYYVRSYVNGVAYTYSFYFSEDEPSYILTSENKTTEKNGLEIFFLVDEDDFKEFKEKSFHILPWLSIVPNVWSNTKEDNGFFQIVDNSENIRDIIIKNKEESIVFENEKFLLVNNKMHNHNISQISFIQGGVIYGLQSKFFEAIKNLEKFNSYISSHLYNQNYSFIFKFEIGDLEIHRSRETLSLSKKKTIPLINKVVADFFSYSLDYISKSFDNCTSEYSKLKIIHKFKSLTSNKYSEINGFSEIQNHNLFNFYIIIGYNTAINSDINADINFINSDLINKINNPYFINITDYPNLKYSFFYPYHNKFKSQRKDNNSLKILPFNYDNIYIVFKDSYRQSTSDIIHKLKLEKNNALLIFDVVKTKEKTDFFKEKIIPLILEKFNAEKDDLKFIFESLEPNLFKSKKEHKKHFSYNKHSIPVISSSGAIVTCNDISCFKNKTILYCKKEKNFSTINNISYTKERALVNLKDLSFIFGINNIDYFVSLNDRDIKSLSVLAKNLICIDDFFENIKFGDDFLQHEEYQNEIDSLINEIDSYYFESNTLKWFKILKEHFLYKDEIYTLEEKLKEKKDELKILQFNIFNKFQNVFHSEFLFKNRIKNFEHSFSFYKKKNGKTFVSNLKYHNIVLEFLNKHKILGLTSFSSNDLESKEIITDYINKNQKINIFI